MKITWDKDQFEDKSFQVCPATSWSDEKWT